MTPNSSFFANRIHNLEFLDWDWMNGLYKYTHLGSVQADDSIYIPGTVIEVGHGDSMFTGGDPVLLGRRVDLEDVGPRAEDGLLSVRRKTETGDMEQSVSGQTLRPLKYVECNWAPEREEENRIWSHRNR